MTAGPKTAKRSLLLKTRLGLGATVLGSGTLLTAVILYFGMQAVASRLETAIAGPGQSSLTAIEARVAEKRQCPHCNTPGAVSHGMGRGLRRYRCKACGTFNATTGTSLHGLHRWLAYGECLSDGMTIRDSAKRCKLAVSTSFRGGIVFWAHRIRTLQISRALSRPMKPMSSKAARGIAILTGRHAAGEARPASGACQMNRFRFGCCRPQRNNGLLCSSICHSRQCTKCAGTQD